MDKVPVQLRRRDGVNINLSVEHDKIVNATVVEYGGFFYSYGGMSGRFYTGVFFTQCEPPMKIG